MKQIIRWIAPIVFLILGVTFSFFVGEIVESGEEMMVVLGYTIIVGGFGASLYHSIRNY